MEVVNTLGGTSSNAARRRSTEAALWDFHRGLEGDRRRHERGRANRFQLKLITAGQGMCDVRQKQVLP